jgi:hypothetical protein
MFSNTQETSDIGMGDVRLEEHRSEERALL